LPEGILPSGITSGEFISATEILVLVVCLLLSACFSGIETALAALPDAKARAIVESGTRRGRMLKLWLDKPHHVLTTTLIGDHAVNTVIAVVASLVAERMFQSLAITIGVAVAVIAVLVFGEITPRSFAKTHASAIAPTLMPLVWGTYVVFFPLVVVFTRFSHVLVRVSGGAITRSGPFVTEDDIAAMITLGSKEGVLDKHEGRMLKSVLDLGDTLVREVMVPRTEISALPMSATLDQVLAEAREKGHSRMPVFDDTLDEVKGFFHTKDLLQSLGANPEKPFSLKEHLRPVLYVPELMRVSDLLKLFQKRKTHLAVVVDEYGGTAGIVAFEDVLEEIVGPIQDEHDDDEAPIKRLEDGRYVAEGRASLYELAESLGVAFPADGGYETLGGFLIARTGRMPQRGDRVVFAGHVFFVRDADEKRVARVDIERTAGASTPPVASETSGPSPASPATLAEATMPMPPSTDPGLADTKPPAPAPSPNADTKPPEAAASEKGREKEKGDKSADKDKPKLEIVKSGR
jgi:putative hemolysin